MTDPFAELNAALPDTYVIDRELGRGGMALVYLARDKRHERFVALKTLRPEIAMALGRERFLREIKLAAGLRHRGIARVRRRAAVTRDTCPVLAAASALANSPDV